MRIKECGGSYYFLTPMLHDFCPQIQIALKEDRMTCIFVGYLTGQSNCYFSSALLLNR